MSKLNGVLTNNTENKSKEKIRQQVVRDCKNKKNVLEVFCGSGKMYKKVWKKCDKYVGIDIVKQEDERKTICGDAEKTIKKLDISDFNIFDVDAYGDPYAVLQLIIKKMDKKRFNEYAFIITDGLGMDLKMAHISRPLREIAEIKQEKLKGAHKLHDVFIRKIVTKIVSAFENVENHSVRITTGNTGVKMKYYSVYIKIG